MSQVIKIKEELEQTQTIRNITSTFQQIATIKIREIKVQVVISKIFFDDIWKIYLELRLFQTQKKGDILKGLQVILKGEKKQAEALIVITSTVGLAGQINRDIISHLLPDLRKNKATGISTDIFVIGRYGQSLLDQKEIPIKGRYDLPGDNQSILINQVVNDVKDYKHIFLYFAEYKSLAQQVATKIELSKEYSEEEINKEIKNNNIISPSNYIFEPSVESVVKHFESVMVGIAIGQKLLESKLSQYASRLIAMDKANDRANDIYEEDRYKYNRAVRSNKDQNIKELVAFVNSKKD